MGVRMRTAPPEMRGALEAGTVLGRGQVPGWYKGPYRHGNVRGRGTREEGPRRAAPRKTATPKA